jgi:hippurate hydrolase
MCDDGLMDRWGIQEVYGMHNWPGKPVGSFSIRPGPFFAATDEFDIAFEGKGGHAAKPHDTVDTTVMAAHAVTALQTIASRNADPVDQIVVSVTSFQTSSQAFNVIPQGVHLRGTVRTLSPEMRALAERRIRAVCEGVAATFGGTVEVHYHRNYPVMSNHDEQTDFAAEVARAVSGDCEEAPQVMGGEDFAYMLEARPGAYILVGNGDTAMVHHPEYDFNDATIPAGCSWWAEVVERRMPAA